MRLFGTIRQRLLGVLLTAALLPACGGGNKGTYILLKFDGATTPGIPIASIAVETSLGGKIATASFLATPSVPITLPTTAYLEIGAGEGRVHVHAVAQSESGEVLGEGDAEDTVTRGKTVLIPIKFVASVTKPDAGATNDAPVADAQSIIDTSKPDMPTDRPIIPATDGSIVGTDGGPVGTGGSIPATGGTIATTGGITAQGGTVAPSKLIATPDALSFPATAVGTTSRELLVSLGNTGSTGIGPLEVLSKDPAQFPIRTNTCSGMTLAPATKCSVSLVFSPASSVLVPSALVVNAPGFPQLQVPLAGQGVDEISSIELTPTFHDFGPQNISSPATQHVFTVRNTGTTTTTVTSVGISTANPVYGIVTDGCTSSVLAPAATCFFTVQFKPVSAGNFPNSVSVKTSTGAAATVSITGTGGKTATVTVLFSGTGKGSIQGPGLVCASDKCTVVFDLSAANATPSISLRAMPDANSVFGGYTGGPCGIQPGCDLLVADDITLTARFDLRPAQLGLNVLGIGGHSGTLSLADGTAVCPQNCGPIARPGGTVITINAKPIGASTFAAWTEGPCKGTNPQCTFTLGGDTVVSATFAPQNYMFVSSSVVVPGLIGGLEAADKECQRLADKASLPGAYKAWLSTATVAANGRVGKGGWIRTDGKAFSSSAADLASSTKPTVYYPPRVDETGLDLGPRLVPVLTGSTLLGNSTPNDCAGYTSQTGTVSIGASNAGAVHWTNNAQGDCAGRYHLYCFRSDLAGVAVAPPEIPGKRLFVSREFFLPGAGRAQADVVCRKEAQTANLAGTFIAFLSTTDAAAIDRLQPGRWKRTDQVLVAGGINDFITGGLMASVGLSADQSSHLTGDIWAGAQSAGSKATLDSSCQDFMSTSATSISYSGYSYTTDPAAWFGIAKQPCNSTLARLLCIEP